MKAFIQLSILAVALTLPYLLQAAPSLTLSARATGTGNSFYFYLTVKNGGAAFATDKATNLVVTAQVPTGATFVSANLGGTLSGSTITWNINNLAGKGTVTPTFIVTAASGSITLAKATTGVVSTEITTAARPAADVIKTVTAASAVIEISATGNDATAVTNLVTNADGSKSTHASFPYKTWVAAMTQIMTNNKPFQTVKFRSGSYDDANNDVQSTNKNVNLTTTNWTGKTVNGLVIDGQGAEINGLGSTNNFFSAHGTVIKDLVIKNFIFSQFKDSGSNPWSVLGGYDLDGLVVDNCIFYSSRSYQPFFLGFQNNFSTAMTVSGCVFSGNSFNTETVSSGAMEVKGNSTQTATNPLVVNLNNTLFSCNRRNGDGGALKLYGNNEDARATTFTLSGCTFRGNTSSTTGNGGAALYLGPCASRSNPGSLNIYQSNFHNNILNGSTSAIGGQTSFTGQIVNINGGTYDAGGTKTTPGLRGGAIGYAGTGCISINGITVTNNYASASEGGVRVSSGTTVVLANSSFSNNTGGLTCNNVAFTSSTITAGTAPNPNTTTCNCGTYARAFGSNITGNVFDDANGYNDMLVNGTGVTSANAGTLHVSMVNKSTNKVVAFGTVNATTGAYTIAASGVTTDLATASVPSYALQLSTTTPSVGATPPAATAPAGWAITSENFAAPSVSGNDGAVDASLTSYDVITHGVDNISNLNFAINKIPVVNTAISVKQTTPTDYNSIAIHNLLTSGGIALFGASDLETAISSITIESFPTNATSFSVGTTTYFADAAALSSMPCPTGDCFDFPTSGGVAVATNSAGVPTDLMVDPSFTGTGDVVFNYTTTDAASSKSLFGTATIPFEITALPIKLVTFAGSKKECQINALTWVTATEENNQYFEVQRSTDGIQFESIAQVEGAGNSTATLNYTYNDNHKQAAYYRLRQVDFDGQATISTVIYIKACQNETNDQVAVFPNPALSELNIKFDNYMAINSVSIYNTLGQLVAIKSIGQNKTGVQNLKIDINELPQGTYFLKIEALDQVLTTKIFSKN